MTALASVELGGTARPDGSGSSINGECLRQETLAISGSTATLATAVTPAEANAGVVVARIQTDDAACYVAIGETPDPTATTKSKATRARRLIPAGGSIELPIVVGEKVAVKSTA